MSGGGKPADINAFTISFRSPPPPPGGAPPAPPGGAPPIMEGSIPMIPPPPPPSDAPESPFAGSSDEVDSDSVGLSFFDPESSPVDLSSSSSSSSPPTASANLPSFKS